MIKVGLIGLGFMGGMHLACYQALAGEGVKVAAIADLVDENAKAAMEKTGAVRYANGMELIEKADVDIVDICLPTYLHTAHAVAAMKKGRATFIEKPVCLTEEEGKLLLATEKETKVPVMVGQCLRLWTEYVWLKEAVDKKTYGKVLSGVFKRISPRPTWAWDNWLHKPECSGTVALDMHVHDVDIIRYIMGEPGEVCAAAVRDGDGVIQQMFTHYRFGSTLIAAECCWDYPASFPFCAEYRIKFEKATAVFNSMHSPSLNVYLQTGEAIVPELEKEYEGESDLGGNISSLGAYYNELKYFTQKIRDREKLALAPLSEGIRSVLLDLEEIKSAGGVKI